MATRMVPLELGLIDEGKLLNDVNDDLKLTIADLIKYKLKYKDKAIGAKAELCLKVKIEIDESEDGYSIKGDISRKLPSRPSRVTMAIEDKEQDGEPTLFVRKSGSSHDSPRQQTIGDVLQEAADKTGASVEIHSRGKKIAEAKPSTPPKADPETGEILEDSEEAK